MITVPKRLYKNDTFHRFIGTDNEHSVLECGFLYKPNKTYSNIDTKFNKYGVFLLLSGTGIYEDDTGIKIHLSPGCFVQRLPGVKHSTHVTSENNWLEFFICFGTPYFNELCRLNIFSYKKPVLKPGISLALIEECESLLKNIKNSSNEKLPLALFQAQKIIYTLYSMDKNNYSDNYLIEKACELLKANVSNKIKISDISDELGVGYENFRKDFKKKLGISPGEYLINCRINIAKSMLLSSSTTLSEISEAVGYSDQFIFSKQFKKVTGLCPNEFRKIY